MSIKIPLPIVGILVIISLTIPPVFAQGNPDSATEILTYSERRDLAAIEDCFNLYEASFNARDIDWRMAMCLDSYQEFAFEDGVFQHVYDYNETRREVGNYWASIGSLEYSIAEIDITLDGPQAFVRAYTTHIAPNDRHASTVHFALVKIDGAWRVAWDSYNIVRRYTF
ncbi:nuclear transport factor 2 family protein [bacterium]|nr:nuclear transport factor 2 family protein [bacterium]